MFFKLAVASFIALQSPKMNGFRRILGGGAQTPPQSATSPPAIPPLALSTKPLWTPEQNQSPDASAETIPKTTPTTAGLFLRKQNPTPSSSSTSYGRPSSNASSLASPIRKSSLSSPVAGPSSPRTHLPTSSLSISQNGPLNTKDELLMSLLTSEAVVDSRECEILSAEEIEELKNVRLIFPCSLLF